MCEEPTLRDVLSSREDPANCVPCLVHVSARGPNGVGALELSPQTLNGPIQSAETSVPCQKISSCPFSGPGQGALRWTSFPFLVILHLPHCALWGPHWGGVLTGGTISCDEDRGAGYMGLPRTWAPSKQLHTRCGQDKRRSVLSI